MRKHIFRAKLRDSNKWVFWDELGQLTTESGKIKTLEVKSKNGAHYYHFIHQLNIDRNTISEYTGLTDKNGKKIFEGDIIETQEYSDRPYSTKAKLKRHKGIVEYVVDKLKNGLYHSAEWQVNIKDYGRYVCRCWGAFYDCTVIGNIYDNLELLQEDAQ